VLTLQTTADKLLLLLQDSFTTLQALQTDLENRASQSNLKAVLEACKEKQTRSIRDFFGKVVDVVKRQEL
jgi:hypothetical protein